MILMIFILILELLARGLNKFQVMIFPYQQLLNSEMHGLIYVITKQPELYVACLIMH